MKKTTFIALMFAFLLALPGFSQTIHEYTYNVNNGLLPDSFNSPGNIIYPTNYNAQNIKTPVVFVHGITGKVSNSYKANIDQVINYRLNAAFVQLNPLGTPEQNGKLLKRMIDRITAHYGSATVSIVAHSKGGMDTERALYGRNPYNTSIPSFGYEKVDGVYTFSSPLRGARVADVGAALSWTGVAFVAMWYANGYALTSGSVNSFHNWAKSWRINSTSTFRNAYHPNGASYSRINMTEDNTTRWWAHQSDDPCYQNIWYYCYVGNAFHHSAGAYYDAYWEWDWFNSGWRNWHTSNDGFISEYRAKRSVITDNSNALTPGAGDSNYRVMQNANHTSLWERGENHFSNEVAPYLHYGLYNSYGRPTNHQDVVLTGQKIPVDGQEVKTLMMGSNGNTYFSTNGQSNFIVEFDNQPVNLLFYAEDTFKNFELISENGTRYTYNIIDLKQDDLTASVQAVAHIESLPKGVYRLVLPVNNFVAMAAYDEVKTAFAVNMNFKEPEGYAGQDIEIAIAGDQPVDYSQLHLNAKVTMISQNGDQPVNIGKLQPKDFTFTPVSQKPGHFITHFDNLVPGAVYAVRISAEGKAGNEYVARNIMQTFYVKQPKSIQPVSVTETAMATPELSPDMMSVYPNPAHKSVHIYLETVSQAKVHIFDMTGKLMTSFEMSQNQAAFDVSNWEKGIYMIKLQTPKGLITKQLIVK